MIDYIKDTYPSILYPLTAEQFANKHNVRATGYGWWCMDELSTCCCENPVEFQVRAHFGSKQDADYFVAQTMSMVLPAFLNEVVGVCTVNSYKGAP